MKQFMLKETPEPIEENPWIKARIKWYKDTEGMGDDEALEAALVDAEEAEKDDGKKFSIKEGKYGLSKETGTVEERDKIRKEGMV